MEMELMLLFSYAKAVGSPPFASLLFLAALLWASLEIRSLSGSRTGLTERKESLSTNWILKPLVSYGSGAATLLLQHVLRHDGIEIRWVRNWFDFRTDVFAVDVLSEYNMYLIGGLILPMIATVAISLILKVNDPISYYIVGGSIFTITIPYAVTLLFSLTDIIPLVAI